MWVSIPKPATKGEFTVARVWECKCLGLQLPCSSLKHRERLAASISGVGLSRTCLHHCKGLRDFSDDENVFEEPTYNLKKRNLHYRYYIDMVRLPCLEKITHLWSFLSTELMFDYFKYQNYFLTGTHSQTKYDTCYNLMGRTFLKNYEIMSLSEIGDFCYGTNPEWALWWSNYLSYISRNEHFYLFLGKRILHELGLMHVNMTWQTKQILCSFLKKSLKINVNQLFVDSLNL